MGISLRSRRLRDDGHACPRGRGRESAILFQLSTRPGSLEGLFDAATTPELPVAADPTSLFPATVGGADDPNLQGAKIEFVTAGPDSNTRNPFDLAAPPSPYTLMAGSVIVASLVTGLNSDLPGLVIAQVTENAYDTATRRHLLIPQGTRLLGRYDNRVA